MFAYRMIPAYRRGAQTPWGGDGLKRFFGKDIPDERTGEALEASTLPGLESRAEDGRTLTEIAGGELPLLLKLLDAREALSVQVHPGDDYAAAHEGGKKGKAEAWMILHAEPGARLVYGLTPGTEVRALTQVSLEAHLRWVHVSAGDVLYIPAGMVHAIGPGILLYEIQQASDVTYRFWDWGRLDRDGNPRALHWEKACDVARADLQLSAAVGETVPCGGGLVTRYLHTERFILERYAVSGRMELPVFAGFCFLTACCEGRLTRAGESLSFQKGDTFFLPPKTDRIVAEASGALILSGEPR